MDNFKKIVLPAVVLMLLSGVIALLLSLTYTVTGVGELGDGFTPEELVTYSSMVIPTSSNLTLAETSFVEENFKGAYTPDSGEGIALHVHTHGYDSDGIGILVGFNADGTISGIAIVSSSETPGLGTKIEDPEYLASFVGGNDISAVDTITSATYSSQGVIDGVNYAISILEEVKGGMS